jgi:hypothetical protein
MKLCMICLSLAMKKKTNKIANTELQLIVITQERFAQIKASLINTAINSFKKLLKKKKSKAHSRSLSDSDDDKENSMPNQQLGKKRTSSSNRQQSRKKYKFTIKPRNLKDDDDETDDIATIKQKTDTVTTMKSNRLITYKVSGDGKKKRQKKHSYVYLTSNNGRIRNQNTNLSEVQSLVPDEFNAKTQ